jgi:glycerol dehydrogenase
MTDPILSAAPVTPATHTVTPLAIAPAQVLRGWGAIAQSGSVFAALGQRPLVVGGDRSLAAVESHLFPTLTASDLTFTTATYHPDCSETSLAQLEQATQHHQADLIIGVGGGKALDAAKLLAHRTQCPIVTLPTSAATCAAWTALSNIYSDAGAFHYDVGLHNCPNALILDYDVIQTAPTRTLVAGIGDAIAKWYEASVSSGDSTHTLIIAAVQQARILRDILFQKAEAAIAHPGSPDWCEVVDATVLLAGVIGGLGGAQCRTVAAHAVHNGLTHIPAAHPILHGEKVAYGILVQLRLEEQLNRSQLAHSSRQQLLQFYRDLGLPQTLEDLGLGQVPLDQLRHAAEIACHPDSDLHHLPFAVTADQLLSAMVATTVLS